MAGNKDVDKNLIKKKELVASQKEQLEMNQWQQLETKQL